MQEMQETQVRSLGWEDPLEEGTATQSSVLAWRIPWTEEPGSLSPQCCKELDMTEVTWHAAIQQNEIMECTVNFEMTACCLFDYLASKKYSLLRGNL